MMVDRVHKEALAGTPVIDVNGSYLYRKEQRLSQVSTSAPLPYPGLPFTGWESVTAANVQEMAKNIPHVMPGL